MSQAHTQLYNTRTQTDTRVWKGPTNRHHHVRLFVSTAEAAVAVGRRGSLILPTLNIAHTHTHVYVMTYAHTHTGEEAVH